MEVYFDWEMDDSVEQPIHKWVYEDLRKRIKERYKPLEDEIDRRKDGPIAFAVFIWNADGSIQTKHFHIPEDLSQKLNEAITQEDMDYFMNTIGQKIDKKSTEN